MNPGTQCVRVEITKEFRLPPQNLYANLQKEVAFLSSLELILPSRKQYLLHNLPLPYPFPNALSLCPKEEQTEMTWSHPSKKDEKALVPLVLSVTLQ